MKRAVVILTTIILVLSVTSEVTSPIGTIPLEGRPALVSIHNVATAAGEGDDRVATQYFTRKITSQQMDILNTYATTSVHQADLSFSDFQVPGWRLYNVNIDIGNITATAEKEVVGVTNNNTDFRIEEHDSTWYSQLAQGFYNQPHDGVLLNYSIFYYTVFYDAGLRNNASFVVRSATAPFLDSSDITTPVNMTASNSVYSWATVTGENTFLSADTVYWAVIDGSDLIKAGVPTEMYPRIFWLAEGVQGAFESYQRGTSIWILKASLEGLMNYTYVPWNQTENEPLSYSSTQKINLKGNSSSITSFSFDFSSSTKNIMSITFDTNQSIHLTYDMTLSYVKNSVAISTWNVASSGGIVDWATILATSYPSVSGQVFRYLNLSVARSWDTVGLYESSAPTTNHTSYTRSGNVITCSSMTDGTWRLTATSFNHLVNIATYDSSDDSTINDLSSIQVDMDVNLTLQEENLDAVTSGFANLTIVKSGSIIWAPVNKSVTNGAVNYLWDIDTTTSDNGAFTLEVSWANGTDAGYLKRTITIFYPTSFTTSTPNINAFTESTFDIRVYFEDTFTPLGLDDTQATIEYSFDGGSNTTLVDHNNGTWTASISTVGKAPGTYIVDVYAEGYALQNRSLQVTVNLIHDTETLAVLWSNTNNISYIESTELSVAYNRVGGTPILDATVNVTINTTTWTLIWNEPSQTYKVTFDGSDNPPGYGTYNLTIKAWKLGHKVQVDTSQTLSLQDEPTTLDLQWSSGNDITYVESTTLIANYTMSDGSPVSGALVNVTIDSNTWTMVWNEITEVYEYTFDGTAAPLGFGFHEVSVEADKLGYEYKPNSSLSLTISKESTSIFVEWDSEFNITYIEQTYLIVHYNMSDGTPIFGATVNVTIDTQVFILTWHAPSQTYRLLINGSDNPPGLGTYSLLVQADLFGFESMSDNSKTLVLRDDPTTLLLSWSDGNSISYIEQTTLSASYMMSNGSAIRNAIVNVTIGVTMWDLDWDEGSQTYKVIFFGSENPPGFGEHVLTVQADYFGFTNGTESEQLIISEEQTTLFASWSYDFNITYIEETYLIVQYNMSDGSSISGATVNVTISSNVWTLNWDTSSQTYRLLFNGSDDPPGIGTHMLVIQADLFGYESWLDASMILVINKDPTTLVLSWSDGNNITYIEQTTLSASYSMSNGSAIRNAILNVTIDSNTWVLVWHEGSQTYRKTFLGTDSLPGFGTHSLTVKADLFGFVGQPNTTAQLTISEDPTTLIINWSNGYNITYVEQTTLSVSYRMSNTTPISDATVAVTIGVEVWVLAWNPGSESYEATFRGDDDPPGIGEHSLTIEASLFGFESQSDSTENLYIEIEPTTLTLEWWLSDTISYIGQTVIYANFTMSNGSAIVGAYVTVAIGTTNKTFEWNTISELYSIILSGDDPGYLLGVHLVIVQATMFGYEQQTDDTQRLTVMEEQTSLIPSWSPDNNITYFESTTLSVRYEMSDGTAIPDAVVNVTIGSDVWILVWNPLLEDYEYTFGGSDDPPGIDSHTMELRASKYGYESRFDDTQQLTLRLEDTKVYFEWAPSSTITYVEQAKLRIFYQFANGTPVLGATVNITRALATWIAVWNGTSEAYEYTWLGSDNPPGLGSFLLLIKAWKVNFEEQQDTSQTLTIIEEPTQIQVSWLLSNNITYVQSTILMVNYTSSSGVSILDAFVQATIVGVHSWVLTWSETSQLYEYTFAGSDEPPGFGTYNLTIECRQSGYDTAIDMSETLTLREEPTSLIPTWSPRNTITFVEFTTLSVRYEMSNGSPVTGSTVNVTIGLDVWVLIWNSSSEAYEYTFSGTDDPPGLGTHSLYIQSSKWGFAYANDSLESLVITEGSTSLVISWSNTNNISYVSQTTLSVRYQMSNNTAIEGAILNVTINGNLWDLVWNAASERYEVTIRGDEDPPGYGTHTVEIRAAKYGFVPIFDDNQEFTIRLEETVVSYVWSQSDTITYTGQTKIRISYLMSNTTPIEEAIVNISLGLTTWFAVWNASSQAYEYTWLGTANPPSLGSHILLVQAWKVNYVAIMDSSQTLTINEEPTNIEAFWTDGNAITYVQSTTLQINYTSSDETRILGATLNVTIGTDIWSLVWNPGNELYEVTFNGADNPPGLGFHGLIIRAWKFGYELTTNSTMTLTISGELGSISSKLLEGNTITFIGLTTLAVNYTMSNGTAIPLATVNVTISGITWDLTWHSASQTYQIQFNGTDSPPGFGTHNLIVHAWRNGFDGVSDSTLFLTIQEEETILEIYWNPPNYNNVTYFDYTILYVKYKMSNGTVIQGAKVNVTIDATTWTLAWNFVHVAYSLRFNGSDTPPGFGIHNLVIEAYKFGFEHRVDSSATLILSKDPTSLGISWIGGNSITYVEQTTLSITYKMSNGSDILDAIVNATIGGTTWSLAWNDSTGAYQVPFTGNQDPPGLGSFIVSIEASANVFVAQSGSTSLTLLTESTTATESWSSTIIDWTENIIFSVDFRDSYGSLIDGATTKSVYVNGTEYELLGTNGTYWIEFNNTFDLGVHNVWANFSRFGYDTSMVLSINFTIVEALTALTITWNSSLIDYLGQANLTVDFYYVGTGVSVPTGEVLANITIDGATNIRLENRTNLWYANLTGKSLRLGVHSIVIRAWAYGYEYNETLEFVTVNEVTTDPLVVSWYPSNITIEYTDSLGLTVDYTYYGGDIPVSAILNVTISGHVYNLTYTGGHWGISIPGAELGIGLHTATINAWMYGYSHQTAVTANINVTVAANSFLVTWEPWDLDASYIDIVNVSVVYTQDFSPIDGASVQLDINGTIFLLTYSSVTEMWHFSMPANDIGLGIWNVTVTANKTGYAVGWDSRILSISSATTNLTVISSSISIYYDEDVTVDIYYQLLNMTIVPGALLTLEVDGIEQVGVWDIDHWTFAMSGVVLGLGTHTIYVYVDAFGFEESSDTFDIDVNAIPTSVSTPSTTASIFAYDTTTVSFTWRDTKNSVFIVGFNPEVTWSDTFSIIDHGNGTYSIEIDSNSLHVGTYELQVNFVRLGYQNGTKFVSVELLEIPVSLVFANEMDDFENETIFVEIAMYNAPHATVIDWADIAIELAGSEYNLTYDSDFETYSVQIWLGSLEPGIYNLTFTASAVDCETEYGVIQLEIYPKVEYFLSLEVENEVVAGQSIQITVHATYESGAVSGLRMTVHILIERDQTSPQEHTEQITTNTEGLAIMDFEVPLGATKLTIWADFENGPGEWPASSNIEVREVSPGGMDIIAFIRSLIEDPFKLILVFGGIGLPIAGLLFVRRRRGASRVPSVSVVDTAIPTTPPPFTPSGEMATMQEIIKSNPDGMTRSQIAQALEVTTGKAGAMVRNLLASDSGFEEVREGKLRRIVFRDEE
jgi:hypothetical protein